MSLTQSKILTYLSVEHKKNVQLNYFSYLTLHAANAANLVQQTCNVHAGPYEVSYSWFSETKRQLTSCKRFDNYCYHPPMH